MLQKPKLEWRPQALSDLLDIVSFIADDNPDAAQALKDEIEMKATKLPDHPKLYKASLRVSGLRVGTGYTGQTAEDALLGQNFLQHFEVQIQRDRMVLRPHP